MKSSKINKSSSANNTDNSADNDIDSDDENSQRFHQPIKTGDTLQNRFLVKEMIGEGSFGQVFRVIDQKMNNQMYALKVEDQQSETSMLEREIKVLIEMKKKYGFPQIKFYGQERGYIYCIMGLLGRNLESLARKCGGSFSVYTILRIAIQILTRIQDLHQSRFIHRDIKPENFVIGQGSGQNIIHLIDFGLTKYYMNSKGDHIPLGKKSGLIGTARYASINAHEEMEQSRKDDLESIGYILVYLSTGNLPWMNLQIEEKDAKYAVIHSIKKKIKIEQLGLKLPRVVNIFFFLIINQCFQHYLNDVKNLDFNEEPNYVQLRKYFEDELKRMGQDISAPHEYDWERLPEYKIQGKPKTSIESQSNPNIIHQLLPLQKLQEQEIKYVNQESPEIVILNNDKIQMKPKKDEKKASKHGTSQKKMRAVIVNVQEEQIKQDVKIQIKLQQKEYKYQICKYQTHLQTLNSLAIPEIQQQRNSLLTSGTKVNNYHFSDTVSSEESLPIWNFNRDVSFILHQEYTQGIKKPSMIIRKSQKSSTQVNNIKNISSTFIRPDSMRNIGDQNEPDVDDGF